MFWTAIILLFIQIYYGIVLLRFLNWYSGERFFNNVTDQTYEQDSPFYVLWFADLKKNKKTSYTLYSKANWSGQSILRSHFQLSAEAEPSINQIFLKLGKVQMTVFCLPYYFSFSHVFCPTDLAGTASARSSQIGQLPCQPLTK